MDRILCATDGTPAGDLAVEEAVAIAAESGAEVVFLHVVPWSDARVIRLAAADPLTPRSLELSVRDVPLHAAAEVARARGVHHELRVSAGTPLDAILDAAASMHPRLLVVGSDEPAGRTGRLHHGIGEALTRRARCDVLVVRRHAPTPPQPGAA